MCVWAFFFARFDPMEFVTFLHLLSLCDVIVFLFENDDITERKHSNAWNKLHWVETHKKESQNTQWRLLKLPPFFRSSIMWGLIYPAFCYPLTKFLWDCKIVKKNFNVICSKKYKMFFQVISLFSLILIQNGGFGGHDLWKTKCWLSEINSLESV